MSEWPKCPGCGVPTPAWSIKSIPCPICANKREREVAQKYAEIQRAENATMRARLDKLERAARDAQDNLEQICANLGDPSPRQTDEGRVRDGYSVAVDALLALNAALADLDKSEEPK